MRYVMSDLHGRYDKFLEMLNLIEFKDTDELYILGDIFDRGNQPIEILEHIWSSKNIFLIKGNHEEMFEKCHEDETNLMLWMHNGGVSTYRALESRGKEFIEKTYNYIKNLPLFLKVDNYILAHAGLYIPENSDDLSVDELLSLQTEEYLLWDRELISSNKKIKDFTIVLGHTPTLTINNSASIIHRDGQILIDCGAVFDKYNGRLACFCLDNKKEFYV